MIAKKTILIADDSDMNREILVSMLCGKYEILTASDGEEAFVTIQKYGDKIDLILLDIVMPKMDGFEVLDKMRQNGWIDSIPVIVISAVSSPKFMHRAFEAGVVDYICRPFDAVVVQKRVGNTIRLFERTKTLADLVADQIYEKELSSSLMIAILSHIVEFRNGESGLHVLHINIITRILLQRLTEKTDKYGLEYGDIALISMASALHDIGKISIPDEILNKPGRLTKEEFEVMKTHSEIGANILKGLPFQEERLVRYAYDICRWHHERYDGRGYPDGLVGDDIPIWAQVVSVADVYDALTSERVYKKAFSHEKAMEMIFNNECGTFNPLLLECLKECANVIQAELKGSVAKNTLGGRADVKNIVRELSRYKELAPQERTFELLERERIKNEFIVSVSDDMFFDYYCESQILVLSPKAAELLGVEETVFEPLSNDRITAFIGEGNTEEFIEMICSAPKNSPVVVRNLNVPNKGAFKVYARAIINEGETSPAYILGRIAKQD